MPFADAERYLSSLGIDAMKSKAPSLHRIQALCAALDDPQRAIPAIHVTGTNGKTSTARIATSLLSAAGLSVGTFTSPHLQSITERIARSGTPISEEDFGAAFDRMWPYVELVEDQLEDQLTFFEILTGMFFLWAAEAPVDALVVEVGLGGTWDATNVLSAPVAVLTNIGLDHMALLGTDRRQIAREKVGIIKEDAAVVTGERSPDIVAMIEEAAAAKGAEVFRLERDFRVTDNRLAVGGRYLSVASSRRAYQGLFLPLHGSHQGVNAAIAIEAVARFLSIPLDHDVVLEGLASVAIPGRLETLRLAGTSDATVVLDVAHNPEGVSATVASLLEAFSAERITFVVGILSDKDYTGMLAELSRAPASLILTQPSSVRSVPPEKLQAAAGELGMASVVVEDVRAAVDAALDGTGPGEIVCIIGSHYLVGEARPYLLDRS